MDYIQSKALQTLFSMLASGALNKQDMTYGPSPYTDYMNMVGDHEPTLQMANQIISTYPNTNYDTIPGTIVDDNAELMSLADFVKRNIKK